jgi:hypothetical protein
VPDLPFFDSIFVLTHVRGHMMSGMAGTLKDLGMGRQEYELHEVWRQGQGADIVLRFFRRR